MPIVRKAKEEDAIEFAVLAKQFAKESKGGWKVDMDKTLENFKGGLNNPEFFFWVVEDDDTIVGMLVGATNSPLFTKQVTAVELAWYMQPAYRDGRTALKLFDAFEKWAREKECDFITMADLPEVADLSALYERKGYKLTEKAYIKEI